MSRHSSTKPFVSCCFSSNKDEWTQKNKKMKTAMQEMLDFAKAHKELCHINAKKCKDKVLKKQLEAGVTYYTFVIMEAKKLIEKEKEQIAKAVNDTYDTCQVLDEGNMPTAIEGKDYYNQFYTQQVSTK